MERFNRFYLWGADAKYRMGLYTVAIIFYKGITNALMGKFVIESLTLLEMVLACFVFACCETIIFPTGMDWTGEGSARRTALWALLANVIFIGCSLVFGWFAGVPVWGAGILVLMLELIIFAMWYALWLETRLDTKLLNEGLRHFQKD